MTNDTLYLKIEQNVQVHDAHVTLGDIAQLSCSSKDIENRLRTLKIKDATKGGKPGRHAMSVMELIAEIQKDYPNLEVNNIGEADFLITYENPKQPGGGMELDQDCMCLFFGIFWGGFYDYDL